MPRDYLNYISAPNDDRPVAWIVDERTGLAKTPVEAGLVQIEAEAPAEPVEAQEAVPATTLAEAPVEAASEAPEGLPEAPEVEAPANEAESK